MIITKTTTEKTIVSIPGKKKITSKTYKDKKRQKRECPS